MSAWDGPDWRALKPVSAEQGDVAVIRKAVDEQVFGSVYRKEILVALDQLAAALERAERERDDALGERVIAQLDIAQARAEKVERALAEIARLSPFVSPEDDGSIMKAPAIARAALRPSEDTSDES